MEINISQQTLIKVLLDSFYKMDLLNNFQHNLDVKIMMGDGDFGI